jgi:hypothetical protein
MALSRRDVGGGAEGPHQPGEPGCAALRERWQEPGVDRLVDRIDPRGGFELGERIAQMPFDRRLGEQEFPRARREGGPACPGRGDERDHVGGRRAPLHPRRLVRYFRVRDQP